MWKKALLIFAVLNKLLSFVWFGWFEIFTAQEVPVRFYLVVVAAVVAAVVVIVIIAVAAAIWRETVFNTITTIIIIMANC